MKNSLFFVILSGVIIFFSLSHNKSKFVGRKTLEVFDREEVIDFGSLANRKFGYPLNIYLGTHHQGDEAVPVSEKHTVNFKKQLEKLWEIKKQKSKGNKVVEETAQNLIDSYTTKEVMSYSAFDNYLDSIIEEINENLDWNLVGEIKKLSNEEMKTLREISETIGTQELVAYLLTEIMPTNDGSVNKRVFEVLLQNAGKEYIESIPALGDKLTSFGPYQFTQYAVYDTGKEKRGASIVNQALPREMKIPGSTSMLRGDDHYKAAYLFAINNITDLIKSGYEVETISKEDLAVYIATAHHSPTNAIKYQLGILKKGGWKNRMENYAKKTRANYEAL